MTYIEKFWRDATDKDVVDVINGKEIEARFSDSTDVWTTTTRLRGVQRVGEIGIQWMSTSSVWNYCQVYQPPEWWRNKPDPGEGYRLLGKEPDEAVQGGDFFKNTSGVWVKLAYGFKPTQVEGIWYRRKIEQPKPVFKVGDWVKIAKPAPGIAGTRLSWTSPMDEYDGRVTQISKFRCDYPQQVLVTDTTQWHFHVSWLTPVEQPKSEPKFAVGQRVKIVGPKERPAAHWDGCMDKHIGAVAEVASVSCMVGDKVFYDLRSIEQWAFRADYLEPVEPKHYVLHVGDTVEFPDGWTVTAMGKGIFIK